MEREPRRLQHQLTLSTAGEDISGTGEVCGVGPFCEPGQVTISGQHATTFGPFSLTIRGDGGWVATYAGRFFGHDQLRGAWRQGTSSNSVTLNRCSVNTSCW